MQHRSLHYLRPCICTQYWFHDVCKGWQYAQAIWYRRRYRPFCRVTRNATAFNGIAWACVLVLACTMAINRWFTLSESKLFQFVFSRIRGLSNIAYDSACSKYSQHHANAASLRMHSGMCGHGLAISCNNNMIVCTCTNNFWQSK